MTPMLTYRASQRGFALPTVLIAATVMLIILISAVSAGSSIRSSLNRQYYNQLAREASESGIARATECLKQSGYIPSWSTASPLRPNTDCSGGAACDNIPSCFVLNRSDIRTTFSVALPVDQVVSQAVTVTSKVELLRKSNGSVWKTFTNQLRARVGSNLNFNNVAFGYYNYKYHPISFGTLINGAHFVTIAADGSVKTVGDNRFGQLGNGTTTDSLTPTDVTGFPAGFIATNIYTGFLSQGSNTYVLGSSGDLYGFGDGAYGQLGNTSLANASTPQKFNLPGPALSVTVNGKNTFVLTQNGAKTQVYSSGRCWFGNLGDSGVVIYIPPPIDVNACIDKPTPSAVNLPNYIAGDLNTHPTSDIVADGYTAFVRMEGGKVYGWGNNQNGQLGVDSGAVPYTSTPRQVGTYGNGGGQPKAMQLAFDGDTLYVLDSDGKVNSFGGNSYGQRGDGTTTSSSTPVPFPLPANTKAIKVVTDQSFVSVLAQNTITGDEQVYSAGLNDSGQLGDGTISLRQLTPVKFKLPGTVQAIDVYSASLGESSQYNNTMVVGDDGNVYGAGRNDFGQIGNELTAANVPLPDAAHLPSGVKASQVKTGYGTTIILTQNRKIYTVGNNNNGQLGDGTTTNSSLPKVNQFINVLPVNYY
jgi:alpha-tubulin suppressor-like RCC1 family protein